MTTSILRLLPGKKLNLEAAVYSIDETNSSESLLGKVVVESKDFDSHSTKAGLFPHDLMKSRSSDDDEPELTGSLGTAFVNGKLTLRVFHSAADDKALFEIEVDIRARQTKDGVDTVNKMFKYLFESKDHSTGEEDTTATTTTTSSSNKEENTSTK